MFLIHSVHVCKKQLLTLGSIIPGEADGRNILYIIIII